MRLFMSVLLVNLYIVGLCQSDRPTSYERRKWRTKKIYIGSFSEVNGSSIDDKTRGIIEGVENRLVSYYASDSTWSSNVVHSIEVDSNQFIYGMKIRQSLYFWIDSNETVFYNCFVYGNIYTGWSLDFRQSRNKFFVDNFISEQRIEMISYPRGGNLYFSPMNAYLWTGRYLVIFNDYRNSWYVNERLNKYKILDTNMHKSRLGYKRWLRRKRRK